MPMYEVHYVNCPECGAKGQFGIWGTINAQKDTEAKKQLLDGELHVFHCPSCDRNSRFEVGGMLYHDIEQDYTVVVFLPDDFDDPAFLDEFSKDGTLITKFEGEFAARKNRLASEGLKHPRYVFSLNELATYVKFRDKLFAHQKA